MEAKTHECSQAVTLNTICLKLDGIERSIVKIEEFQENYAAQIEQLRLNSAKYPSPEEVKDYIKKVDTHETRLADTGKLLWVAITGVVGALIILARDLLVAR
jgi:hypothetical protein